MRIAAPHIGWRHELSEDLKVTKVPHVFVVRQSEPNQTETDHLKTIFMPCVFKHREQFTRAYGCLINNDYSQHFAHERGAEVAR